MRGFCLLYLWACRSPAGQWPAQSGTRRAGDAVCLVGTAEEARRRKAEMEHEPISCGVGRYPGPSWPGRRVAPSGAQDGQDGPVAGALGRYRGTSWALSCPHHRARCQTPPDFAPLERFGALRKPLPEALPNGVSYAHPRSKTPTSPP